MKIATRSIQVIILLLLIVLLASISTYAFELTMDIIDKHGSIMLLIDVETGNIEYANQAAIDFYGYSLDDLLAKNISEINILDGDQTSDRMQAAVDEEKNYFIFEHQQADRDIRTVEVYSYPYFIDGNAKLFSIIHDITTEVELAATQRKLQAGIVIGGVIALAILLLISYRLFQRNQQLEAKTDELAVFNQLRKSFIDADNRLVYLKDANLKYVFVNKALEKFYQKTANEIIGQDDYDLSQKAFADLRRETDLDALNKHTNIEDEVRWAGRIYKTNKFPIRFVDGSYGVGAYIEDITETEKNKLEREKTLLRNSILVSVFQEQYESPRQQLNNVLEQALRLTSSHYGFILKIDDPSSNSETSFSLINEVGRDRDLFEPQACEQWIELELAPLLAKVIKDKKSSINNKWQSQKIENILLAPIIIEGKITQVVGLLNKTEDFTINDVDHITILMTGVWNALKRQTAELELETTNVALLESRDQLRLILDSTAEGIYGLDINGKCTFCNSSGLKMLGYQDQNQLIGKNMHLQIHHSYRDKTPMALEECKIYQALHTGMGTHVNDEVFWRADNSSFDVEYYSYPQFKNGQIVGAVVTFVDYTNRKEAEKAIRYLSYHDSLTGLYNRRYFDEVINSFDHKDKLPTAIIVGDMNNLKLTNDIFGHKAGDVLIKAIAAVFEKVCGKNDIVARTGGDEFAVIMPNTNENKAQTAVKKIHQHVNAIKIKAIKGSISLGLAVKDNPNQDIINVLQNAEDQMYHNKTADSHRFNAKIIKDILQDLHNRSPREKIHARNVSNLAAKIGTAMSLSEDEMNRLKQVGYMHDIGKVALDDSLLNKQSQLSATEKQKFINHALIGYRILNSCEKTMVYADSVVAHHENWDGSGYPNNLEGEEIPKLARIIAVAECYDAITNPLNQDAKTHQYAVQYLEQNAGKKFDPLVVESLIKVFKKST